MSLRHARCPRSPPQIYKHLPTALGTNKSSRDTRGRITSRSTLPSAAATATPVLHCALYPICPIRCITASQRRIVSPSATPSAWVRPEKLNAGATLSRGATSAFCIRRFRFLMRVPRVRIWVSPGYKILACWLSRITGSTCDLDRDLQCFDSFIANLMN